MLEILTMPELHYMIIRSVIVVALAYIILFTRYWLKSASLRANFKCAPLKRSAPSIVKDHMNAIKLFVLAAISFVAGIYAHADWLLIMALWITAVLVFSYIYASKFCTIGEYSVNLPALTVHEGQEIMANVALSYLFCNSSGCAYAEFIFPDGITCKTRIFIKNIGKETYSAQLKLKFQKTGVYNIYAVKIKHSDPLGLFYQYIMMYCPAEIMVLPALNKVKPNYACSITAEDTVSKEKGASSDIRKIRDYIYGEDTRFIHWASSAKLGKLMMREFAQESLDNLFIIIENDALSICNPRAMDELLSAAAHLIEHNKSMTDEIEIACALPSFKKRIIAENVFTNVDPKSIINLQKLIDADITANKHCLFFHKESEEFFRSIYPQLGEDNIKDKDLIYIALDENSPLVSVTDTAEIISFITPTSPLPEAKWEMIAQSVPKNYRTIILTLHPNSRVQQHLQSTRQQTTVISFYEPMKALRQNAPAKQSRKSA